MIDWLLNKTYFPKIYSVEHELNKVAILRIVLAFFVFVRYAELFHSVYILGLSTETLILFSAFFVSLLFFAIGFFTPIATISLIFLARYCDEVFQTFNLGTNILIYLLLLLLLINHGLNISIDAYLIRSSKFFSYILIKIYNILGRQSAESIRRTYFLGFLFYAITSMGAVLLHINDQYWYDGLTVQSMLSNSYLFKFYDISRKIEDSYPNLIYVLSACGVFVQTVFQLFMLVLIFFKYGKYFVIFWGLLFFTVSLVGINLSYLPYLEIIYWALIFFTINPDNGIKIIYDDYCGLCRKSIKMLSIINFNGKFQFLPLSKSHFFCQQYAIDEKELQIHIVGIAEERVIKGYNLYIEIVKKNCLLWPLWPIMYLGYISGIGQKIYEYIAKRRHGFFNKCVIDNDNAVDTNKPILQYLQKQNGINFNLLYYFLVVSTVIFVVLNFPILSTWSNSFPRFKASANLQLNRLGFQIPDVFNKDDLSIGNKWVVLYRQEGVNFHLVPITAPDGARMNYEGVDILNFSNHNSDLLYFGCTLRYRRAMLYVDDKSLESFHESGGYGFENILKRIKYDYMKNNLSAKTKYKVNVFSNSSSYVQPWDVNKNRHNPNMIYESYYEFDGSELHKVEK